METPAWLVSMSFCYLKSADNFQRSNFAAI